MLVPAHNESRNVLPTIACLMPQLRAGDRLLVVADNCSDDTAALARDAGALVIGLFLRLIMRRWTTRFRKLAMGPDAAEEAATLIAEFCGAPMQAQGIDALVEASLLVADDIVVMQPMGNEQELVVVAGVVCSPSRWSIQTKLNSNMMAVHVPVPQYADHVGKAVDTTLSRLRVDQPMVRSNWTIEDHCALFQPVAPKGPLVQDITQLWIRMERQTLRALPQTGGSMFTIRTYQQPIAEYVARGKDVASTLYSLVKRLPDDVAKYKSMLHYRDALLEWLEPLTN